jgi:hypothetical protein
MVEKQSKFSGMVAMFIQRAIESGYMLTMGDAYRTPKEAAEEASAGRGIRNSLHCQRLAIDLNAFFNGKYLDGSEAWHIPHLEKLGKLWENLGGSWGGRFSGLKDYNHYSLMHNGVR